MYCLEAVIAEEAVLRELVGSVPGAHIVELDHRLSLVPATKALFGAIAAAETPRLDGFWRAPAGLAAVLAACSSNGPAAYVEAEFFGGLGMQSAQVWHGKEVVFGPLHMPEEEPAPAGGTPISQALRHLGVVKGDYYDEFSAVRLGRHRETDHWLSPEN
jgi:hypothetical protein